MLDHAIQRARERYGVELTPADLLHLAADVQNRRSVCVHKTPDGELHIVRAHGKAMVAVYLPQAGGIVTFLPEQAATDARYRLRFLRAEMGANGVSQGYGPHPRQTKSHTDRKSNARLRHARQLARATGAD